MDAPWAQPGREQLDSLVAVLSLIRSGVASTRPELGRVTGLGRTVVTQRVEELIRQGLIEEGQLGPSSGGRAPRQLRFRSEAGTLLVAELGATSITTGLADLTGKLIAQREEPADIADGPVKILERVEQLFGDLLEESPDHAEVWGVGVGLPGPVEFASGRPIAPPIMPGWDGYPVAERLAERYAAPVWVDNEVNTMALGELRAGLGRGSSDLIFVKIGTGIGAGLISDGRLHRGAQGCAGDVGHVAVADDTNVVCRCGNVGCLEALAGGAALAREGQRLGEEGRSAFLADVVKTGKAVTAADVATAAQHGDSFSVELLIRSGRLVGEMLATLVNFYNPALILIGGGVAGSGDLLLATIRETIYRRSLPLATRELRVARSHLGDQGGLIGAAAMVLDELFSSTYLPTWLDSSSPVGRTNLRGTPAV
ncbi:MAG: hypothetical protein QOJ62_1430 [Actinomycetota bacterium]|nr:hypothetical protein [Actinomycetota bacterium]